MLRFIFDGSTHNKTSKNIGQILENQNMQILMTIALDVDEEILLKRLLNRGKQSGRVDDQDEHKILNRFKEYNKKTSPLIDFYEKQNKFYQVDGSGTIDEITDRIYMTIDNFKND